MTDTQPAAPAAAATPTPVQNPTPDNPEASQQQEQAAPGSQDAQAPEEGDEEGDDTPDDGKAPKRQSRTARYKARIERLEAELAARARNPSRPVPAKSAAELAGPPPNPANYAGNVSGYQAALAGWEARKQFIDLDIANRRADEQAMAAERQESLARIYAEKQEDARAELPDYDRVVGAAQMRVSDAVAEALMESEQTARLEYHLAKNPKTLAELNRMSPKQAALAVGRLEERLSKPQPNRTTQAPAPVTPLKGGGAGPAKSLSTMSMEEYVAHRKAENARA